MNHINKLRQHPFFKSLHIIAKEAGSSIMATYNNNITNVNYKADNSPLTQADTNAHRIIQRELRKLKDIPIISEEGDSHYTDSHQYWLVDPLDGTKEFINRNGEFTVNIALIDHGYPTLGIVYAPVLSNFYIGGSSLGSIKILKNGDEQILTVTKPKKKIKVIASRSHLNQETKNFISNIQDTDLVQSGSSLKFCLIAEGLADIYPRLAPTSEWDTAAAQAVVEGAGGSVLTLGGLRVRYQKNNILNPKFIVRGNNSINI
jgi:3'(2'), 5'-bisphosphate nucleotidase